MTGIHWAQRAMREPAPVPRRSGACRAVPSPSKITEVPLTLPPDATPEFVWIDEAPAGLRELQAALMAEPPPHIEYIPFTDWAEVQVSSEPVRVTVGHLANMMARTMREVAGISECQLPDEASRPSSMEIPATANLLPSELSNEPGIVTTCSPSGSRPASVSRDLVSVSRTGQRRRRAAAVSAHRTRSRTMRF